MPKKFYHVTNQDGLDRMMRSGLLLPDPDFFLRHRMKDKGIVLYSSLQDACKFGSVVIEVEYDPISRAWANNWKEGSLQHREHMPIPSRLCRVIKDNGKT